MDDPELQSDEQILIRTQGVHVKSISFEAILTNKRIILIDRLKNLLPPKEIPLATIQSIEPGENAIRDLVVTLGVITKSGGARQMVLTFSREGGGNRAKERDEWVSQIRTHLTPSFEQVIRKVIPGIENQPVGRDKAAALTSPVPPKRPLEFSKPEKKIMENHPESLQPVVSTPAPTSVPETVLGTYCTRCGTKVPEGSGFCNTCGTRIVPLGGIPQVPVSAPPSFIPEPIPQKEKLVGDKTQATTTPPGATVAPSMPEAFHPKSSEPTSLKPEVPISTTMPAVLPAAPSTKKRFMPKLFSPKDLPPTPLVPSSMPTAVPRPPKKPSNKRKIILVTCIIVIILVAAVGVVVLPKMKLSGSQGTGPSTIATTTTIPVTTTTSTSSSTTPVTVPTQAPVTVPTTGVYVSANYLGGFNGSYSTGGITTNVNLTSGAQVYQIVNATGMVTATFQKADDTTNSKYPLTVGIYENGKDLASNATSASYGQVTVSASV